jgi:hypothetical protein
VSGRTRSEKIGCRRRVTDAVTKMPRLREPFRAGTHASAPR